MTKLLYPASALLVLIAVGFIALFFFEPKSALGSVPTGSEYHATTTNALTSGTIQLKNGQGALGQVVITGKNTGLLTFYDATTSDVTQRTGQKATSTIMIADFPTNAPEGTYTFDAAFTNGLIVVASGSPATSTIMSR